MAKIKPNQIITVDLTSETKEFNASGKTALNISDYEGYEFTTDGKDLTISNGDIVTVKNSSKLKLFKTIEETAFSDLISAGIIDYVGDYAIKKNKVTGTQYNDEMDFSDDSVYTKALTINAGAGNDEITGTALNDTITGGKGENTVYFSGSKDTVVLTKGEQLTLDLTGKDVTYTRKKNDLLLVLAEDEDGIIESVALKNYYKSDVVGSAGYVKVKTAEGEGGTIDLGKDIVFQYENEAIKGNKKKRTATFTAASRFGDEITVDAGSLDMEEIGITFTEKEEENDKTFEADVLKYNINAGNGNNKITFSGGINTNTIIAGSGDDEIDISDTSDPDEIRKALTTVKAGAGKNTITVSGSGKNLLVTGKNDDTFNISGESTTTIKAGAGENTINIDSDDFGTVILAEEKVKAKNNIVIENISDYTLAKEGNDLTISNESSDLTVSSYFLGGTKKFATTTINDMNMDELLESGQELYVTGSGAVNGSEFKDNIYTADSDEEYEGKLKTDTIRGGKGNDTINAGKGNNNICYSLGDGNDTIINGDGADVLVFDKGVSVTAAKSDNKRDVIVTYSGVNSKTKETLTNTITLQDYYDENGDVASNVKYKIGKGKVQALNIVGTLKVKHITGDTHDQNIPLSAGNNTIVFDDEPNLGRENYLVSSDERGANDTDTLQFETLSFMNNTVAIYADKKDDVYTDDLWIDTEIPVNETEGGEILYKDFYTGDNIPKVVLQDKDRSYAVNKYVNPETDLNETLSKGSTATIIKDNAGENKITSSANYNHITAFGGATLDYTYNGGSANVVSLEDDTDDKYTINNFSKTTSLNIDDWGGNDALEVKGTTLDNLRLVFDVYKDENTDEYTYSNKHVILVHKDNLSASVWEASTLLNAALLNGVNIISRSGSYGDYTMAIETINVGSDKITTSVWMESIFDNISDWLEEHECDSISHALERAADEEDDEITAADIADLFKCYTKYEAPAEPSGDDDTITIDDNSHDESNPLELPAGKDNKVVFAETCNECYVTSKNTAGHKDTLQIDYISMADTYNIENASYDGTLVLDTTTNDGGGYIYYTAASNPKVVITVSERSYEFSGYTAAIGEEASRFNFVDGNNMVFITAEEGKSYVKSSDDYNIIKTSGGAGLDYLYNGGHDVVVSESDSDDTYTFNLTSTTSAVIKDHVGDYDTVNVTGSGEDSVRIVFDGFDAVIIDRATLASDDFDFKNIFKNRVGVFISDSDIETLNVRGTEDTEYTEYTLDDWAIAGNNVQEAVTAWLSDSHYGSVSGALNSDSISDSELASLKNCFLYGSAEQPQV